MQTPCDHLGIGDPYPNPTGGRFRVKLDGVVGIDYNDIDNNTPAGFDYEVRIYNNQGVMKRTQQTNTLITEVDISNEPTGTYYLHVIVGQGTNSRVMQKQILKQ